MSDILANPNQVLEVALCGVLDADERLMAWAKIHRHVMAGGALPAHWHAEGTAVGRLVEDAELNASALGHFGYKASDNMTRERIRAVTGKG